MPRTRARWMVALLCIAFVASVAMPSAATFARPKAVGVAAPTDQADWAQYDHDPAHTGYNPAETVINASNVGELAESWRGVVGPTIDGIAVANGVVYVGARNGKIYAFDATGTTNCSGTPKLCAPLWSGLTKATRPVSTPAVADGVVYVGADNRVYAFDANGLTNCSGTPTQCKPLWHSTNLGNYGSSPTVANGVVFIGGGDPFGSLAPHHDGALFAFDANGVTNCNTGWTTRVCQPLWTGRTMGPVTGSSSPAVVDGIVYAGSENAEFNFGGIDGFDAAGVTNCSGSVCDPVFEAPVGVVGEFSPTVVNGLLYIVAEPAIGFGELNAIDATGTVNCTGSNPRTCRPVWAADLTNATSDVAVANGVLYVGWVDHTLAAFDAAGVQNCDRRTCYPLWTSGSRRVSASDVTVANGVVYAQTFDGVLAFDAAGSMGCSGQPLHCQPLWHSAWSTGSAPVVVNGTLYLGGTDGNIHALTVP